MANLSGTALQEYRRSQLQPELLSHLYPDKYPFPTPVVKFAPQAAQMVNYASQVPYQPNPSTYQWQPPGGAAWEQYLQQGTDMLLGTPTGHQSDIRRKVGNMQNWWQEMGERDLGVGAYQGQATNPLSQLQYQLGQQYNPNAVTGAFQGYDFGHMMQMRNRGIADVLNQRAAQMGVKGAYGGVIDQAQRARETMAEQALAAYRPQAWQAQQQASQQTQQLLAALQQMEFETERTMAESKTI